MIHFILILLHYVLQIIVLHTYVYCQFWMRCSSSQVNHPRSLWCSVPAEVNTSRLTLSLWAVRIRGTLLDGQWEDTQTETQKIVQNNQDLHVESSLSAHLTLEFTGVSLNLERNVILSTSLYTVSPVSNHYIYTLNNLNPNYKVYTHLPLIVFCTANRRLT